MNLRLLSRVFCQELALVVDFCAGPVWLQPWGWWHDSLPSGWGRLQGRRRVTGKYNVQISQEHLTMLICQARTPTCRLRLPTNYNQGKLLNTQSFMIDVQKMYKARSIIPNPHYHSQINYSNDITYPYYNLMSVYALLPFGKNYETSLINTKQRWGVYTVLSSMDLNMSQNVYWGVLDSRSKVQISVQKSAEK